MYFSNAGFFARTHLAIIQGQINQFQDTTPTIIEETIGRAGAGGRKLTRWKFTLGKKNYKL
jgi:hypothetical protein